MAVSLNTPVRPSDNDFVWSFVELILAPELKVLEALNKQVKHLGTKFKIVERALHLHVQRL